MGLENVYHGVSHIRITKFNWSPCCDPFLAKGGGKAQVKFNGKFGFRAIEINYQNQSYVYIHIATVN